MKYNRNNVNLDDEKMWDKFTYFFRVEKCHNDWTDEQIEFARNDDDLDEFIEWLNENE